MNGLSGKSLRTFSDGVRELYGAPDVESLSRRTLRLLTTLIPAETAVFGERTAAGTGGPFRSDAFILHGCSEFRKNEHAYRAYLPEHPIDTAFAATHDVAAITFDRLMPPDRWHRTGLYNEFFRPLRLENILCAAFESDAMPFVSLGIVRGHGGFSPREHFLLDLLRPHIAGAYDLVQRTLRCRIEASKAADEIDRAGLTPREFEVLHWVRMGKTNSEIAIILGAARLTVKKHVENILRKLNVETRTAAAVRAVESGLSVPDTCRPDARGATHDQ
ncbi:MAG: hypothetical protein H7Z14_01005 [Anaerolineae bacterium]|nr:hypothetical protein [Phycisphaerae bacterium]